MKILGLWLLALLTVVASLLATSTDYLFLPIIYALYYHGSGPAVEFSANPIVWHILNLVLCVLIALVFGSWTKSLARSFSHNLRFCWVPAVAILLLGICDYFGSGNDRILFFGLVGPIVLVIAIVSVFVAAWEGTRTTFKTKRPPNISA